MESWTAERFETKALEVLAELMIGRTQGLADLAVELRSSATEQLTQAPPPDPWTEPAMVYGALAGLAEFAEVASRRALSPEVLKILLASAHERLLLLDLSRRPGGMMVEAAGTDALAGLVQIGLVERQKVNATGGESNLEVTPKGWLAVDLLERWGPES